MEALLTWDPVNGSERPEHADGADRRQAHVVSVQGILHHAVGKEERRQGVGDSGAAWGWGTAHTE